MSGEHFEENYVKVGEVDKLFKTLFDEGFGDTIELKINGELYEVLN